VSELLTDQVIAIIGAALVTGVLSLIGMQIKHRHEDEKERRAQRAEDEKERKEEREKRAQQARLLQEAYEKLLAIDQSVNNRDEPVTVQLDRIEKKQEITFARQAQHSRDINGLRKDINLMYDDIGLLHQTNRRITEQINNKLGGNS